MAREPIASTRACSRASNTARACLPSGASLAWMRMSWQARLSARESPMPRVIATSSFVAFFGSSGRRARLPASAGLSLAKPTSSSLSPEMARMATVNARLKLSASEPDFDLLRVLSPGPAMMPARQRERPST